MRWMKKIFRSRVGLVLALLGDVLLHAVPHGGQYGLKAADLRAALAAQEQVTARWIDLAGVVGTAVGMDAAGKPVVKVYLTAPGVAAFPATVAGVPVVPEVTGPIVAYGAESARASDEPVDPKRGFPRPVPIGVSTGHPAITAGTIGARVTDGEHVYALSNNHVLAAVNQGREGDPFLQPGVADGGHDPDDAIGTLAEYEPIEFCQAFVCPENRIDAALALTTKDELGNATPDGGYGTPRRRTEEVKLGMTVQKYGRTTGLTVGRVTGVHATIDVGYGSASARFVDQIVISDGTFSNPGDSGSLVVTKGVLLGDRRPVGLLFAGSNANTIANPIDLVLQRFGVSVDGEGP
jgi:hypothetical protein